MNLITLMRDNRENGEPNIVDGVVNFQADGILVRVYMSGHILSVTRGYTLVTDDDGVFPWIDLFCKVVEC